MEQVFFTTETQRHRENNFITEHMESIEEDQAVNP